ncbi:MAG: ribonuclease H-like domain-containing protein [Linnemannia gamsii]|nr:MAG: ribonuclease H-like domain-containing protein [Linnemannia gamsii]
MIRTQEARLETIQDQEDMVTEFLRAFHSTYICRTKTQPARILFKRDGVFEGEFTKVLHEEVGAIRSALRKFNISYTPKIIVVVSRSGTMLGLSQPNESWSINQTTASPVQSLTLFTTDSIQELTYRLCYLYARCN